jgi:predicted RNase H-like HicB family nuclease
MQKKFNIIIEQGLDGYLISSVLELPGCHTQAKSYDTLIKRTKEAIKVYLESKKKFIPENKFIALQQINL